MVGLWRILKHILITHPVWGNTTLKKNKSYGILSYFMVQFYVVVDETYSILKVYIFTNT